MHLHTGHYSPLLRPLPQFPNFFPSRDFFLAKNTKPKPHKTNLKRERMREIEIFVFSCPDSGGLEYYCLGIVCICVFLGDSEANPGLSITGFVNHRVRTKFQQITSKNPGYTTFFPNLLEGYGKRTQERRRRLRAGSPSLHHFCTLTWMKTLGDCQAEILRTKKGICVACEPDAQSKGPFRYPKHPRPKIHSENLNH